MGSPSRFFSAKRGSVIGSGSSRSRGTVVWGVADMRLLLGGGWRAGWGRHLAVELDGFEGDRDVVDEPDRADASGDDDQDIAGDGRHRRQGVRGYDFQILGFRTGAL